LHHVAHRSTRRLLITGKYRRPVVPYPIELSCGENLKVRLAYLLPVDIADLRISNTSLYYIR
jgi:hypothetical protein